MRFITLRTVSHFFAVAFPSSDNCMVCLLGSDLRKSTTSVTRSLCEQIFTSPIHWAKAANFPETATHAIDFGPGGVSGIGPLTARNLEGRGVRVVIVGDKARGQAELYNSQSIQTGQWWGKEFTPKLVKTRSASSLNPVCHGADDHFAAMEICISTRRSRDCSEKLRSWSLA